ncbi:Glutamine amidotransferase type-2 domain-containing protein [Psidium guajava]|nr:Glutamine amidotransferase type-2 domain-containing protein [Psidium guajava]
MHNGAHADEVDDDPPGLLHSSAAGASAGVAAAAPAAADAPLRPSPDHVPPHFACLLPSPRSQRSFRICLSSRTDDDDRVLVQGLCDSVIRW